MAFPLSACAVVLDSNQIEAQLLLPDWDWPQKLA
jgi:hypothetical protein